MNSIKFRRYDNVDMFKADVYELLLENEVCNNLPISFLMDSKSSDAGDQFMGTVINCLGSVVLIALCVKPFNMLLYEPNNRGGNGGVRLLARELKRINFNPPGVFAVTELARRFANEYYGGNDGMSAITMVLMQLNELKEYKKASGFCRLLSEEDLVFTPYWEQAFCIDCRVPAFALDENKERIRTRIGTDSHFIWEDGVPVAQAVFGRSTPNGAVINWVYTPPLYRGLGYATSVVAAASKSLFDRGKRFCCLFADADNPASRRVYHKLGYTDVCEFEQIEFDAEKY